MSGRETRRNRAGPASGDIQQLPSVLDAGSETVEELARKREMPSRAGFVDGVEGAKPPEVSRVKTLEAQRMKFQKMKFQG